VTADARESEAMRRAMQLVACGASATAAAKAVGVSRETVSRWKHGPGRACLQEARASVDAQLREEAGDQARALRGSIAAAIREMRRALKSKDARVRLRAAEEILDRVGVGRTSRVENVHTPSSPDLSKLTDAELDVLTELMARAAGALSERDPIKHQLAAALAAEWTPTAGALPAGAQQS
jgi:transposase